MATLQNRISQASKITTIPEEVIKESLKQMGIDDSEIGLQILEADTTIFDDFKNVLFCKCDDNEECARCKDKHIPVPKLKFAWSILKDEKKQTSIIANNSIYVKPTTEKPIPNWTDIELLEHYEKDGLPSVEEELQKRTHGRTCIIFNEDGKLDIENSLYMVRKAHRQDTPKTYLIRNELKTLYRVGDFPADIFYECPVHSNILLLDDYCEECSRKWDTDPSNYDHSVFLRLIVENEDIDIRIYKNMDLNDLKANFPKVYIKFKELKEEGKLPPLKRRLSKSREGDPFRVVHTSH